MFVVAVSRSRVAITAGLPEDNLIGIPTSEANIRPHHTSACLSCKPKLTDSRSPGAAHYELITTRHGTSGTKRSTFCTRYMHYIYILPKPRHLLLAAQSCCFSWAPNLDLWLQSYIQEKVRKKEKYKEKDKESIICKQSGTGYNAARTSTTPA